MSKYEKLIVLFLIVPALLFLSTRDKLIWRQKVVLTLKLFSENIYFKEDANVINVGSELKAFLSALESKKTVIKGVNVKPLKLSLTHSLEDLDVAFTNNIKLAKKLANKGILVFSSNKKCTDAAFIITINRKNKLNITYNKENIKKQRAEFPDSVFKTIDKYTSLSKK